jgi:hypothetical protein
MPWERCYVSQSYAGRCAPIAESRHDRLHDHVPQRKKAIAYYRVSTQQQSRSGLGIEAQQQAVTALQLGFMSGHGESQAV